MLNRLFYVVILFVLTLGLVLFLKPDPDPVPVPASLVLEIEEKLNKGGGEPFSLGFVTLFDSINKETKLFPRESQPGKEVENEFFHRPKDIYGSGLKDNASEIKELSTISILGLSGIKIKDTIYNTCKYITVDNQSHPDLSELICKSNENQEKGRTNLSTKALEVFDPKFVKELGKISGINNIGLVLLTDYKTGQPKLFLGKDNYVSLEVKDIFPLLLASDSKEKMTITNLNTWTVVTYRQNPCKSCSTSGGSGKCTRVKDSSC